MTFALGAAGTGETFLAVAVAAAALNNRTIKRIILCRPAARLGFGSKAVITGDVTQTDLPEGKKSGLQVSVEILGGGKNKTTDVLTFRDSTSTPPAAATTRSARS